MSSEKLQKVLAKVGLGSRRTMEEWISAARVRINGKIAKLGARVTELDKITVDNKSIFIKPNTDRPKVWIYHKPVDEICTHDDPEGRTTVFDRLPRFKKSRWIMVGRLDINTSGLLLFTNNGELANRLMHPRYEVEREYAVRVFGEMQPGVIQRLLAGVKLDDGMAKFNSVVDAGGTGLNHWYHVTLSEGRTREVRRLWESQNLQVSRLIRVRYGNVALPTNLPRGKKQELSPDKVNDLCELVKLKPRNGS